MTNNLKLIAFILKSIESLLHQKIALVNNWFKIRFNRYVSFGFLDVIVKLRWSAKIQY